MHNIPQISVIIPLFNEEQNLPVLHRELVTVLKNLNKSYEIIFVDDGSRDDSFNIIKELLAKDENIIGLSLSRNFGHQVALLAGIEHSSGETVVTMDADFQHPPGIIKDLYDKYSEGYDVVNTRRIDSKRTGFMKRTTSKLYYKLINLLSDVKIEPASSDFRLMSRKAVEAFLRFREKSRFTRGLVSWMGFRQTIVGYHASERFSGKSKYTIRKMLSFGMDGITSFSSKPLRITYYLGLIIVLLGLLYALYAIIQHFRGATVPGWTSILISVLIIGGVQLLSLGIIGEYIARIYNEAKGRPVYFIRETATK